MWPCKRVRFRRKYREFCITNGPQISVSSQANAAGPKAGSTGACLGEPKEEARPWWKCDGDDNKEEKEGEVDLNKGRPPRSVAKLRPEQRIQRRISHFWSLSKLRSELIYLSSHPSTSLHWGVSAWSSSGQSKGKSMQHVKNILLVADYKSPNRLPKYIYTEIEGGREWGTM